MFVVYVLKSIERKFLYVGMTNSIERRLRQHKNGKTLSTKGYRPFTLALQEEYSSRQEARNREKYLKSGAGKEYLKRVLLH